eukprot:PITA_28931
MIEEEVSGVLKEMQNGKALGPDGFNVDSFKACRNIVKQDFLRVAEDSKKHRPILKALNSSFIALIAKQEQAQTPDKFRPIALCNVVYKRYISRILGFQRDSLPSKYLGVPLTAKPFHNSIYESIISKLQDKTRKWTTRSLNLAGRLVLTKVVLQSIPIFMLSTIPAPKGILHQMRNIERDFLWGKGKEKKKWALVAWDKICKPKNHGGLGLDDLEILCKVLGGKLCWRWIKEPEA